MEEKKIVVHNLNNLPTINYRTLNILQGDLKTLEESDKLKLCKSIIKYGFFVPAFVWRSEDKIYILDATQRYHSLEALEKAGYGIPEIPYVEIYAKDKKDAAEKLLQITSRYGKINPETKFFEDFKIDLDYIGEIEIPELDIKLDSLENMDIIEDETPEVSEEPATHVGDLWLLGKHRVLCGDSAKVVDAERLMESKKADMVFTDPPYGINLDTNRFKDMPSQDSKTLKRNHYVNIVNDDIPFDFTLFEDLDIKEQFWWGANFYCHDLPKDGVWFVWDKKKEGMEKTLGGEFELCWSKQTHKPKIVRILWTGFLAKEKKEKRVHPTQKPTQLAVWFLNEFSRERDTILDFFLGSGTTLIAAEQLNRICYGMEIEPHYVDVILERYAKLTGNDPVREDGKKWSEIKTL